MIKTITQEGPRAYVEQLDDEINAMTEWKVIEVSTTYLAFESEKEFQSEVMGSFRMMSVDPTGWVIRLVTMISIDS